MKILYFLIFKMEKELIRLVRDRFTEKNYFYFLMYLAGCTLKGKAWSTFRRLTRPIRLMYAEIDVSKRECSRH